MHSRLIGGLTFIDLLTGDLPRARSGSTTDDGGGNEERRSSTAKPGPRT